MQASMPSGEAKQGSASPLSAPGDIQLLHIGAGTPDEVYEALGQRRQRGIPARTRTRLQVTVCSTPLIHLKFFSSTQCVQALGCAI